MNAPIINLNFPSVYENSEVLETSMYTDNLILRKEFVCQKQYGITEQLTLNILYNLKGEYISSLESVENEGLGFIKYLTDVTHNVGFNEKEQQWYGWSHRAYYSFGIGSEVKKGDCGYVPDSIESFIEDECEFWDITGKELNYTDNYIFKNFKYANMKDLIGQKVVSLHYTETHYDKNHNLTETFEKEHLSVIPDSFGKGEWVAKTLEDAKQMALDFASGVS